MFKQGQWRTVLAVTATIGGGVLALPTGALAAGSSPLQVGTTDNSATPAVVVDAAGTGYVAWTVPASGTDPDPDQVEVCSIPKGGTSCTDSSLLSAPGNPAIGSVQLTIDGPDVVLVADQFQTGTDKDDNYVNEWTAPDGSVSFSPVDGGESVSQGQGYGGDSLFTLPSAGTSGGPLGYGFSSIGDNGGQYYVDVIDPFNAAPECSEQTEETDGSDTCPQTPQATMAAPGDASAQAPNYYASQSGADPGVLAVLPSLFSSDCGGHTAGMSFMYGSGDESSSNSYGVSPGSAGSAWRGQPVPFDCNASSGIAFGGSAGLGALTDDTQTTDVLTYRTLKPSSGTFNPAVTVDASEHAGVSDLGGGEDGMDGVYATYEDGNSIYKGPNDLSYSPDGGYIWDGPVALTNLSLPLQSSTSAVGTDGQGWLVWTTANGSGTAATDNLYVEPFDQQEVPADPSKLSTKQAHGSSTAINLVLNDGARGEYDKATLTGTNAKYATGKVTYKLLSGSCSAAATRHNEGTVTVLNGVIPASRKVSQALAPGKYYWEDTYTGDRNNAKSISKCGSEVLTIKAPRS